MLYFEQLLINGLMLGAIYALAAVAYTLVYGVVKMVNFAFGELFMLGAFITLSLMLPELSLFGYQVAMPNLNFFLAALVAMVAVAALGALIDRIAYRPLRNAPRMASLITSIAVSVLLQSLAQTVWGPSSLSFPETPLTRLPALQLGEIMVTGVEWLVMASALVAMIALQLFVHYTSLGRAMRASAQDPTAAYLVGIPVNRIIGLAFVLGSAFAAFAGILYAQSFAFASPTMGFAPGLKALTAAVLGGIGNIPGAAVGGLLLGLVESLCSGYIPGGAIYQDALSFVLLVLLLLVRPQGLLGRKEMNSHSRGSLTSDRTDKGSWVTAPLRLLDGVFASRLMASNLVKFVAIAAAVGVGFGIQSDYWLGILVMVLLYGMLASGLNIVVGFAGLLDLGFVAFWAVGAYYTSIVFVSVLQGVYGLDIAATWWVLYANLIIGGLIAALFGVFLGYPTLRVRGDYLAIMTLGFGEIVRVVVTNWVPVTNGPMGIRGIPSPMLFGYEIGSTRALYFFALALSVVLLFCIGRVVRSFVGRAWVALREDDDAAEAMGIHGTRYKLLAYACSGFVGGLVGVFYAHFQQYISPISFTLFENIVILMLVVLGGMGTMIGPFVGAAVWIVFLQASLNIPFVESFPESRYILLGAMLIALMLFRPSGLAAKARQRLVMG
ncbi:ABC transporter permease [Pseudomonas sp. 09C 129]|uniref:ABC transporter permease n=1 Tax=Pseudomonas sp. 09C 129 TaxID=2054915 RepID=UPI000C6ED917|nr:ABC transporter permease [Pseudomonas sp. 09C 129]AUG01629.1 ABC transporter permease [Pseudomonas sp. 09C 129]